MVYVVEELPVTRKSKNKKHQSISLFFILKYFDSLLQVYIIINLFGVLHFLSQMLKCRSSLKKKKFLTKMAVLNLSPMYSCLCVLWRNCVPSSFVEVLTPNSQ